MTMKTFRITVTESVEVEAETAEEAREKFETTPFDITYQNVQVEEV